MSSLLSEVLASAGKFKKEELHSKLTSLSTRGDELKANVDQFLTGRYADFNVVLASTCNLYSQVKSLAEEVDLTAKRIETEMRVRLDASAHEFEELSLELHRCQGIIRALEKLMAAHECVQAVERSMTTQSYKAASLALARLQGVLDEINEGHEGAAKVVQALHTECIVQRESLRHALAEQWNKIVVCIFKEPPDASRAQQSSNGSSGSLSEVARLSISLTSSETGLGDLLQAMDGEGMLDARLRDLAGLLLNAFFRVILKNSSSKLLTSVEAASQSRVLTLSVARSSADVPKPQVVLERLQQVLGFVHEHLSTQCTAAAAVGAPTSPPPSVMRRLGSHAAVPLLEALVDDCLALAVPCSQRDLGSFRAVADQASEFQAFLTSIDFLPADGNISMLSDYVSNVHVLFANKKCQEILESARELMKTDLLHMQKISPECDSDPITPVRSADDQVSHESPGKHLVLHRNTFRMPPCCISQSASGLIAYAHRMLDDAADSSGYGDEAAAMRCAAQIFCCVRGMFELYCAVSPVYHRRQVEQLPQAAALFYNNSMYLAHELLTLGHAYRHKWLDALDAERRMTVATFVDLVPKLRALGTDCFLQQLHKQKQLLAESMKIADGFKNLEEGARFAAAERGVGQCMSMLRHLHCVWKDVLPVHTYLKAIGALLNGVLDEVVLRVLDLEDITEQSARLLEHLCNKISDASPLLFVLDNDASSKDGTFEDGGEKLPLVERSRTVAAASAAGLLQRHTPKWQRFKELQRLFSASLHDISERWADGKGPLASEFSSGDVRQLVRALFQNTERRAAVLAKIR